MRRQMILSGMVCLIFSIMSVNTMAQQHKTGKVVDAQSGLPLGGATVRVKATGRGTTTNDQGIFFLKLSTVRAIVLISYVGYEKKAVDIGPDADDFYIKLQPVDLELNQLLVESSAGSERPLLKTPESINTLTPVQIERNNAVFLEQSLNQLPNVQMEVRSGTSQSHVVIRGIGNNSRFNMRGIKTYLNGIPITGADGTTQLDDIDFTTIGHIEVIKGPNASLYGANTGGVLNLYTVKPAYNKTSLAQSVIAGSYDLLRTNSTLKAGSERSRFLVNYGYQNYDGYRNHESSTKDFLTFMGHVQASSRQQLSVLALYSARDDNFPGELDQTVYHNDPQQSFEAYRNKDIGANNKRFLAGITHTYNFSTEFVNSTSIYAGNSFLKQPIEPFYKRTQDTRLGGRSVFTYDAGFGRSYCGR